MGCEEIREGLCGGWLGCPIVCGVGGWGGISWGVTGVYLVGGMAGVFVGPGVAAYFYATSFSFS